MTHPTQLEARFKELAEEVGPLQHAADKIKVEMLDLAFRMSLQIAREAFPAAAVQPVRALFEIKPSDYARNASEAVKAMQNAGVTPTLIIADETRKVIILATEPILPRAAKPRRTVKSC